MEHKEPLKTSDFHYELPKELIAQTPLPDRADSRLLTLDKRTGGVAHRRFRDIAELLDPGDCLVLNDTKVMPARLVGRREGTGAAVELLLLSRGEGGVWEVLARPGKRALPGDVLSFGDGELRAEIVSTGAGGVRSVRFIHDGVFEEVLDRLGETPLPPYIRQRLEDRDRYQTVYANEPGSAAAPTAGLHFTEELLAEVAEKGVSIAKITLHVGLGTFRPVKTEEVAKHEMHTEYYSISESAAEIINSARRSGGRIIAVGTTSARTLESAADASGFVRAESGQTGIFIYPPYEFKAVDALITNFHLPESTLIMLVSALAGREATLAAYAEAVRERYRFFSFGDAVYVY